MATSQQHGITNSESRTGVLHLLTPAKELEALREPTAGVDLMDRYQLHRCYEEESRRTLRKGISHFLSPALQVLIKEKPRIALSEKAEFAELLSEGPSGKRIEELSVELLRRSFFIRRRVATASGPAAEEDDGGVPVPPDVPMAQQTTNKFSPAFAKKAKQIAKQASKRPRPLSDEEGETFYAAGSGSSATTPPHDVRSAVKPLISKLVAMKWPGWSNPFMTVFKKSNAPPRYFEFIKRPMNLTFIRDNVNKNKYISVFDHFQELGLHFGCPRFRYPAPKVAVEPKRNALGLRKRLDDVLPHDGIGTICAQGVLYLVHQVLDVYPNLSLLPCGYVALQNLLLFMEKDMVEEVEVDLELIVSNALTFNRPIDPVYQFALELQTAFRSELPLIKQAVEEQQRRQGGGGSVSGGTGGQFDNKKQRVR